jgi:uncharacterized protein (TIGR01777 family)
MKILITGGTGFIGRTLCHRLLDSGHELIVLSRRPEQVIKLCGKSVTAISNLEDLSSEESINAIINLSGKGIADRLWTKKRKQKLLDSRINITKQLIAYVARAKHKPSVMISGSAVGYYGNNGQSELDETTDNPDDFAQQLCKQWEAAVESVKEHGVRLCIIRIGLVIGRNGGFVKRMLLPFKLGLGGRLGNGQQWMSWIHKEDLITIVEILLNASELEGNFNATAPQPVTNAEFSACLANNLHRPAIFPVPAIVLKLLLGEMSELLLGGQKVLPERLIEQGFPFQYKSLDSALKAIL